MLGLAGAAHCTAMCAAPCAAVCSRGHANAGTAWAFHLARVIGYSAAGAILGAGVAALTAWGGALGRGLQPLWLLLHLAVFWCGLWLLFHGRQPEWLERLGRGDRPCTRTHHRGDADPTPNAGRAACHGGGGRARLGGMALRTASSGAADGRTGRRRGRWCGRDGRLCRRVVARAHRRALDLAAPAQHGCRQPGRAVDRVGLARQRRIARRSFVVGARTRLLRARAVRGLTRKVPGVATRRRGGRLLESPPLES